MIADAGAALLALLVATTLSVYKPWGRTGYGRRMVGVEIDPDRQAATSTLWASLWIVGIIVVLALFITPSTSSVADSTCIKRDGPTNRQ